jgi:hypothetical protein
MNCPMSLCVGERFSTFRKAQRFIRILRGLLDPEDCGTRFVQNVENRSPNVTAPHHRRPESPPEFSVELERHASRIGSRMRLVLLTDGCSLLPQNYITINFLSLYFITICIAASQGTEQRPKRALAQYTCVHVK